MFGLSAGATTAFAQTYNIGDPVATDVKAVISGSGSNLTLTISGTGKMQDFTYTSSTSNTIPWYSIRANIKTLVINLGVTSIGNYAFYYCTGFTGSLTIPNSVTTIGWSAFEYCSGFTGSLTIGNSVTTIGEMAFYGCSGFTGSLTIGSAVTTIGYGAFEYCSGFTGSLTIGNAVTTIGEGALGNCSGFTGSLTIGNSVTTIGNYAFRNCSGFTGSLTIPNSVTTIGKWAFDGCSGLTGSLTIPNSVTTIGQSAFYGCSGFTGSLTIGNAVTTIGKWAFYGCNKLISLTLGNNVATIGEEAFYDCTAFTSINSPRTTPPVPALGTAAFKNVPTYIPVNIPCGMKIHYENSAWKNYFYIFNDILANNTITVQSNNNAMGTAQVTQLPNCTDKQAVIEATANAGYKFIKWSDNNTQNPRTIAVTQDITLTAIFDAMSGINEVIAQKLVFYPNPVKDELIIKNEELRMGDYSIFNVSGQVLMQGALSTETTNINVKELPSGMYFIKVGNKTGKFVKE